MAPKSSKKPLRKRVSGMNVSAMIRTTSQSIYALFDSVPDSAKDDIIRTLTLLRGVENLPITGTVIDPTPQPQGQPKVNQTVTKVMGWDREEIKDHPSANWLRLNTKNKEVRAGVEGQKHSAILSAVMAANSRGIYQQVPKPDRVLSLLEATTVDGARLLWPREPVKRKGSEAGATDTDPSAAMELSQLVIDKPYKDVGPDVLGLVTAGYSSPTNDYVVVGRKIRTDHIEMNDNWLDVYSVFNHKHDEGYIPTRHVGPILRTLIKGEEGDFRQLEGRIYLKSSRVLVAILEKDWDTDPLSRPSKKRARIDTETEVMN
jgi:hypothetical protein